LMVEDSGVEPLTEACKATVFPTIPIPRKLIYILKHTPTLTVATV